MKIKNILIGMLVFVALFADLALAQGTSRYAIYGNNTTTTQIRHNPATAADLGDTLTIELLGAPAGNRAWLLFSLQNQTINGMPLPLDMAPYGAPNQLILTGSEFALTDLADQAGKVSFNIPIPRNVALKGMSLYFQGLIFSNANPLGIELTNGYSVRVDEEVVLVDRIGRDNTTTNGRRLVDTHNSVPFGTYFDAGVFPIQGAQLSKLKELSFVGAPCGAGHVFNYTHIDLNVWSSLQSAITNYASGDVLSAMVPLNGTASFVQYGTSAWSYNGQTYMTTSNLMPFTQSLVIQPNVTYYVGISIDITGAASWCTVESSVTCNQSDWIVGNSRPLGELVYLPPGWNTGCLAVKLKTTRE